MKCDLCKRDVTGKHMLCATCAEAVQRAIDADRRKEQQAPREIASSAAKTAAAA